MLTIDVINRTLAIALVEYNKQHNTQTYFKPDPESEEHEIFEGHGVYNIKLHATNSLLFKEFVTTLQNAFPFEIDVKFIFKSVIASVPMAFIV